MPIKSWFIWLFAFFAPASFHMSQAAPVSPQEDPMAIAGVYEGELSSRYRHIPSGNVTIVIRQVALGLYSGDVVLAGNPNCVGHLTEIYRSDTLLTMWGSTVEIGQNCINSYIQLRKNGNALELEVFNRAHKKQYRKAYLKQVAKEPEVLPTVSWRSAKGSRHAAYKLPRSLASGLIGRAPNLQDQCELVMIWGRDSLPFGVFGGTLLSFYQDAHLANDFAMTTFWGETYAAMSNGNKKAATNLMKRCSSKLGIAVLDPQYWRHYLFSTNQGSKRHVDGVKKQTVKMNEQITWAQGALATLNNPSASAAQVDQIKQELSARKLPHEFGKDFSNDTQRLSSFHTRQIEQALAAFTARAGAPIVEELIAQATALPADGAQATMDRIDSLEDKLRENSSRLTKAQRSNVQAAIAKKRSANDRLLKERFLQEGRERIVRNTDKLSEVNDVETVMSIVADIVKDANAIYLAKEERARFFSIIEPEVARVLGKEFEPFPARSKGWNVELVSVRAARITVLELNEKVAKPLESIMSDLRSARMRAQAGSPLSNLASDVSNIQKRYIRLIRSEAVATSLRNRLLEESWTPSRGLSIEEQVMKKFSDYVPESEVARRNSPLAAAFVSVVNEIAIRAVNVSDISLPGPKGEPSADDMMRAVWANYESINREQREASQRCRNALNQGLFDPLCIAYVAGASQIKIADFTKVACRTSQSVTGFVCDFEIRVNYSGPASVLAQLPGAPRSGINNWTDTARFIPTRKGWLLRWD